VEELKFELTDDSQLQSLFDAFCKGAEMNPDPPLDEDEGNFFFDANEIAEGLNEGNGDYDEEQYEDGEEGDQHE